MKSPDQGASRDGRRLRSERSKRAIIEAVLALQEAGNLVPTAQQISDRAGVGIRSFFRHFEDMESLFEAVASHMRGIYQPMFLEYDEGGAMEERLARAVLCYAEAYERLRSVNLSAVVQRWHSQVLRRSAARAQHLLHKNLENRLPELRKLPQHRRQAADTIVSFEMWHRLREHQGLSQEATVTVLQEMLLGLFRE